MTDPEEDADEPITLPWWFPKTREEAAERDRICWPGSEYRWYGVRVSRDEFYDLMEATP